jgi:citrate synthase
MPLEPDPELSHAANYLYMMTGRRPTPTEEKIMDIALILHADHGMNASTFASLVVASTLSDMYMSISSGVAALNGPLHGGANERVIQTLEEIRDPENVKDWYERTKAQGKKIPGFGHRVYKRYDPRARILGPIAKYMTGQDGRANRLLKIALELEKVVVEDLGSEKGIYPNVDFYSGLVYTCLGIPTYLFTPTFAVARVAGWTARVLEYMKTNRIFRPRAIYTGRTNKKYMPLEKRVG